MRWRGLRTAHWLALASFLGASSRAALAPAAVDVTLVNHDADGNQLSRFDTAGNALDAHDGTLVLFGDTYYLYGTSYACGYQYQVNSKFCGFKIYSSTDLVHFEDRGFAVPAGECQYCFRPHVIYNESTKKYVMWSDAGGVYHVRTSDSPLGPFEREKDPTLAVGGAVDESLFVDADGTGYLIHNTTLVDAGLTADMVVEKLTSDYLTTTGESVRLGLGDVEAFAVFERNGKYHALMSDPSCAYCAGGTGEMTASSMLGPWSGSWYDPNGVHQSGRAEPRQRARLVNDSNCGGQPLTVLPVAETGGSTRYLFVSDRWNDRAPNESLANVYIGPLDFSATGELLAFDCLPSFGAKLAVGTPDQFDTSPEQDQSSGFDGFRHYCDISGSVQRQQAFSVSVTGTLTRATVTTFRSQEPDAPLLVELLRDDAVVSTTSLPASDIPWAPRVIEVEPNLAVTAGDTFTLRLSSATTSGCYGFEYNDGNPYAGGQESYSTDAGVSFTAEPKRDLKFTVDVVADETSSGGAGGEGATGTGDPQAGTTATAGGDASGSSNGGGAPTSAGASATAGNGAGPKATPSKSGCGCALSGNGHGSVTIAALLVLAALGRRRSLT
jgi:MYXO-CTERM domain-containing protein